jgi:hypothetical protein
MKIILLSRKDQGLFWRAYWFVLRVPRLHVRTVEVACVLWALFIPLREMSATDRKPSDACVRRADGHLVNVSMISVALPLKLLLIMMFHGLDFSSNTGSRSKSPPP